MNFLNDNQELSRTKIRLYPNATELVRRLFLMTEAKYQ
jgi:hypothetical protein